MSLKENSSSYSPERSVEKGSVVASIDNLGFSTYDRVLFENLSFNVKAGEVSAITGLSGSGKTIILKILAGRELQDEGKVSILTKNINYVPQQLDDIEIDENVSIQELFKRARGLDLLGEKLSRYEKIFSEEPSRYTEIEKEYGKTLDLFIKMDGYNPEIEMNKVLSGLGIDNISTSNISLDTRISDVSSGQLRKIMIARALYSRADLLLMDDPTSHLDVNSVEWLSNYLKNIKSAVVLVSNSRKFLDSCVSQTIGLTDIGRVFVFDGIYSEFEIKRDSVIEAEKLEAESVAGKLNQLKETDKMFRSKQAYKRSADMAQVGRSLGTRIQKLEKKYDNMPGSESVFNNDNIRDLVYTKERRSGNNVVRINQVVKRYGEFEALDLKIASDIMINQGEKWLIWGPNGSGKSTLVKMIASRLFEGDFNPDEGSIETGASIDASYFAPDNISISRTGLLIDEALVASKSNHKGLATSVLRYFGFSTESIYHQNINSLSSGERKRVALAKIMLEKPNLMILDEPTGDFMSGEIMNRLASALNGYNGTLILVSHDLDFINQLKLNKELQLPKGRVVSRN